MYTCSGGICVKQDYSCYASAAFGLEGLVADELRRLGLRNVTAENGGVRFSADPEEIFICNLKLHFCDRVFILAEERKCTSFEDLYQLVSSVAWQEYMDGREAILVSAKCARSTLMSPRDCQSITKKAIIDKLREATRRTVFPENGSPFPVLVSIHSDLVKILINTSGDALSRRGYRTWNGEAPLRETLAAALVQLSPWKPDRVLYDPCCGTGTILIEAAFKASCRAPGLRRSFAMEYFQPFMHLSFDLIRQTVSGEYTQEIQAEIRGSDIDPEAVRLANRHIQQAQVGQMVQVEVKPLQQVSLSDEKGVFICNPPYGERLSDQKTCRLLYRDLRALKERHSGWSMCVISSDPSFERSFGRKADKKRRLYNGRLECTYYIYY